MGKHVLSMLALWPLLAGGSHASQPGSMGSPQPFEFKMEDSDSGGYLGVDIADISAERVAALKLKDESGVEVTMVDQDAPAGKSGIKEHDVILTLNGSAVESKSQLHRMIRETPPGRTVTLGLSRDGQPVSVKIQLADRNKEFEHIARMEKNDNHDFHFEMPEINIPDFEIPNISVVYVRSSTRSGLMVENLTPQLCTFFGTKDGSGVLVRSVEKGSRAEKAGLRAGDVIVRVGDRSVHDSDDFTQAMHTRHSGSVNVAVIRDKKEINFTLSLPERKDSGKVIDESSEAPVLDAGTEAELSELKNEIAKLRPEMELAEASGLKASEEMQKAFAAEQKHMSERVDELKSTFNPKIREEIEKSHQKVQKEMERLRQQLQGAFLDI